MKKWMFLSFGIIAIAAITTFIINYQREDFQILGNVEEVNYVIGDEKPNLIDGVTVTNKGKIIDFSIDDSEVNWNVPGKYLIYYKFNKSVIDSINIIIKHKSPFIINTINLIYYLEDDELNFFATDIRAYDVDGKDITYNKNQDIRITVDDSKVNYNMLGVYQVTYKIIDDYGNIGESIVDLVVKKEEKTPVFYGWEDPLYLEISKEFSSDDLLYGIKAFSNEGIDLTNFIIIDESKIDFEQEGKYQIEYIVNNDNNIAKVSRDVIVLNVDSPVIIGVKDYEIIDLGNLFVDFSKDVEAHDYNDKDITDDLKIYFKTKYSSELIDITEFYNSYINEIGDYYIVYESINSLGNNSHKEMYVKVINDVDPPIITGTKDIIYPASNSSPDLLDGVEAFKYYDDVLSVDLTHMLTIKIYSNSDIIEIDSIDFTILSSYLIVYSVTDDSGNTKEVERNLYIIDLNEPVFYNIPNFFTYTIAEESKDPNEIPDYKNGVVAWDLVDGDLTSQIAVVDNVNYYQEGEYFIDFVVSDNQNNVAKKRVVVYVFSS
ncbi:MAG: immunoglobulin-like domain-containing protein [Bacilli bacterium]